VVDYFGRYAFEVEAFSSNAFQTFCRLVQPKMGADFTLNRTRTYDTIVGGGNMVLAINSAGINYGASPPGGLYVMRLEAFKSVSGEVSRRAKAPFMNS